MVNSLVLIFLKFILVACQDKLDLAAAQACFNNWSSNLHLSRVLVGGGGDALEACVKDQEKETFKTKKCTVVILLSRFEKFITVLQFETFTNLERETRELV